VVILFDIHSVLSFYLKGRRLALWQHKHCTGAVGPRCVTTFPQSLRSSGNVTNHITVFPPIALQLSLKRDQTSLDYLKQNEQWFSTVQDNYENRLFTKTKTLVTARPLQGVSRERKWHLMCVSSVDVSHVGFK